MGLSQRRHPRDAAAQGSATYPALTGRPLKLPWSIYRGDPGCEAQGPGESRSLAGPRLMRRPALGARAELGQSPWGPSRRATHATSRVLGVCLPPPRGAGPRLQRRPRKETRLRGLVAARGRLGTCRAAAAAAAPGPDRTSTFSFPAKCPFPFGCRATRAGLCLSSGPRSAPPRLPVRLTARSSFPLVSVTPPVPPPHPTDVLLQLTLHPALCAAEMGGWMVGWMVDG